MIKRFRNKEQGQGMVEYGLILALVSIVALVSLSGIGGKVKDTFQNVADGTGIVGGGSSGGVEIPEGFIPIANVEDLNNIATGESHTFAVGTQWEKTILSGLDKQYIQVQDIDLSRVDNFTPIGTLNAANSFKGTFDGGGFEIKNLTVDHGDYAGLFGRTEGATLKNIGLVNADISGNRQVGGLVGWNQSSTITSSYATGTVTGNGYSVGGLVGYNELATITGSYATGKVTGNDRVGGLVGSNQSSSTITGSYATGRVTGKGNVGGLVGYNYSATITGSYATGTVTGIGSYVGGLVGQLPSGTVQDSGWANDVGGVGETKGFGSGGPGTNNTGESKTTIDGKIQALGL